MYLMGKSMVMVKFFSHKMKKPLAGPPHASPTRTIHLWFSRLVTIYYISVCKVKFWLVFLDQNRYPLKT